ncbi:MAG: cysteine--tRNA ligase [Rhabdochlamydiaceae bacterium]
MTLKLYNTETRKKEVVRPLSGRCFKMYTCGPTVYNYAHIGNFRTYVFEDLLRRSIKYFGWDLIHVMNITDVDDKTIKGAIEKKCSLDDYTSVYTDAFFKDLETLRIQKAEHYPRATDYISQMIEMIQILIDKGVAYYGADRSIYYAIERFPSYGRLSHLRLEDLKVGDNQRIGSDEYDKEHISDFVLWKAYDKDRDGEIYWDSAFGPGRPGWHIECSAMATSLLSESIDIHVGGVDNMFPHHENEIAQCEACTQKTFVKHWLHVEHLLVDNKKMSKSLGNFYTLRDLLDKGYSGREVRYLLLQTHYKTPLNFTLQGLDSVRHTLQRWDDFIYRMQSLKEDREDGHLESMLSVVESKFKEALAEDLNISMALSVLFEFMREVNATCDQRLLGKKGASQILELLRSFDQILGIWPEQVKEPLDHEIEEWLKIREESRLNKNWEIADHYRNKILSAGYMIEDSPSGARVKKAEKI